MLQPLTPTPALRIEDSAKTVVVADIHLGYEFELASQGINLPSQASKLRDHLNSILKDQRSSRLLILGDLKHNIPRLSIQEWHDLPLFIEELSKITPHLQLIPGNHDVGINRIATSLLETSSKRGVIIREKDYTLGFFHGHAWPSPKIFAADYWIIGHIHPAVQFRGLFGFRSVKTVWVKAALNRRLLVEAFLKHRGIKVASRKPEDTFRDIFDVEVNCSKLIILPAFNELLGGLALNGDASEKLLGPILGGRHVNLGRAEVFLTDGTFLGQLKNLRKISW